MLKNPIPIKFECQKCGACCKVAKCSLLNAFNQCTVYDMRPYICNVYKTYSNFKSSMSLQEYYTLNKTYCKLLQEHVTNMERTV